jgi:glycosyltransferase involved in cell wall biosynthesis
MKYLVAQLGARMHYAVPRILHDSDMLAHLYTDICAVKSWPRLLGCIPRAILPPGLQRLRGRVPHGLLSNQITAFTSFGFDYQRRRASASTSTETTQTHLWAGKRFCELILQGLHNADAVYTFNSAGLELLIAARQRGLFAVMEQTIAPRETEVKLLQEAQERYPSWEPLLSENSASQAAFVERERAEWAHAHLIVCGSEFVRDSIAACGGPADKCRVVPYGVDESFIIKSREQHDGPLRVLTVGGVGLRKGSPTVLACANALRGRAVFRMVGNLGVLPGARASLSTEVEITGAVPRTEIHKHFRWADAFLLPSLCEGSATVVYEALAAGLPVVCTHNTGSIVRHGTDGFIVPLHEPLPITNALMALADDRALLHTMGINARARAGEHTLSDYQRRLLEALGSVVVHD